MYTLCDGKGVGSWPLPNDHPPPPQKNTHTHNKQTHKHTHTHTVSGCGSRVGVRAGFVHRDSRQAEIPIALWL